MILKLLSLIAISLCNAYPSKLKVSKDGSYKSVTIVEFKKLHLSSNCIRGNTVKCAAFEATKIPKEIGPTVTGDVGHPASRYCLVKGGSARILISDDTKQYDFCLFSDGSMIDSWNLYYKHFPK